MEDIHLDEIISNDSVAKCLRQIFPDFTVFHYDFSDNPPVDFDSENSNHIIFNTQYFKDNLEFKFKISIYRTPDKDSPERQIYIGKIFSDLCKVRVLVPFTNPDDPQCPYYDLIFENGKTFLADDNDTSFADGTKGIVKVIKEFSLPHLNFDRTGRRL